MSEPEATIKAGDVITFYAVPRKGLWHRLLVFLRLRKRYVPPVLRTFTVVSNGRARG